ncbi:hypothetical protein [Eubacterium sp.]
MKIRANMHFKDAYTCDEEYIIERAVTISSAKFDYMCKHLLEDNIYILKIILMRCSTMEINCIACY